MSTLIYSPGIQVGIGTTKGQFIDVSADMESGNLVLNEGDSHQLQFTLSNRGGKYNQLFTPNDKIVVQMKRIRWLQTFTGYLDTVPYFTVYDRSVTFTATCTSKRIQFHWWDPGYALVLAFMQEWLNNASSTGQIGSPDAGMSAMISHMLTDIIGWPKDQIHIGTIPRDWMKGLVALWSTVQAEVSAAYSGIGGLVVGGNGTVSNGTLSAPYWNSLPAPAGASVPVFSGPPTPYTPSGGDWGMTMQWPFLSDTQGDPDILQSRQYLANGNQVLLVANANTGQAICVQSSVDGFPSGGSSTAGTGPAIALSTKALLALGLTATGTNPSGSEATVDIAWAPSGTPVGPYAATGSTTSSGSGLQASVPTSTITSAIGGVEAANIAITLIGLKYKAGSQGPSTFDDAGLVYSVWKDAGVELCNPPPTVAAMSSPTSKILSQIPASELAPGDLLFANGSVAIFVGNNSVVQAIPGKGVGAVIFSADDGASGWVKTNPAYTSWQVQGAPSSGNLASVSATTTFSTSAGSGLNTSPSGELIQGNWYPSYGQPSQLASELTGLKVLMNDTPIGDTFNSVVQAGLRTWCTGPDGSFIAWFPDYFDQYNLLAKWYLSPIEMQDLVMYWSDQNLITHQFTAGTPENEGQNTSIDPTAGGESITDYNEIMSMGVATIDIPDFLSILFKTGPTDTGVLTDPTFIYQQFGARPNFQPMVQAAQGPAEFWYAVRLFLTNWASMWNTSIPMTFMPELRPGMLLVLQQFGFQVYVHQVTHTWDLSEGGGFATSAVVMAPSDLNNGGLIGFAKSGNG